MRFFSKVRGLSPVLSRAAVHAFIAAAMVAGAIVAQAWYAGAGQTKDEGMEKYAPAARSEKPSTSGAQAGRPAPNK